MTTDVEKHGTYPAGHPNAGMHPMADGTMMAHDAHGKQGFGCGVTQSNSDM